MGYLRLDKVKATAHIESFVSETDVKNGQFVNIGAVLEDQGGEAVAIDKAVAGGGAEALVTTVQGVYQNTPDFDITKEVTKAGKAGRAHVLETGNVISFLVKNDEVGLFTAGDDVAVGEGGLGIKLAEGEDRVIGKVQAIEFQQNIGDLVVVRIK